MQAARDPVGDGLVESLAKPGGNVTGSADIGAELMVKRLQLIVEAVGTHGPVGYLTWQPFSGRKSESEILAALQGYCRAHGVHLNHAARKQSETLEELFATLRQRGTTALVLNAYALIGVDTMEEVVALMLRYKLPAIMETRSFALRGVLMSYGESYDNTTIRAIDYVDRVLKGASPSALPISPATSFDLTINVKTAKAMGIALPRVMLLRAAELIE